MRWRGLGHVPAAGMRSPENSGAFCLCLREQYDCAGACCKRGSSGSVTHIGHDPAVGGGVLGNGDVSCEREQDACAQGKFIW